MKKIILITISFLLIIISGCSKDSINIDKIYNEYWAKKCVYAGITYASEEIQTETYKDNVSYYIYKNYFKLDFYKTGYTDYYRDVNYKKVKINRNMSNDNNCKDFLLQFKYRYDIYSNKNFTGYTIFANESGIYIGKLKVLNNEYQIINIFATEQKTLEEKIISNYYNYSSMSIEEFEDYYDLSTENNLLTMLPNKECYKNTDKNEVWFIINSCYLLKIVKSNETYSYNLAYYQNGLKQSQTTSYIDLLNYLNAIDN